MRRWRPWLRTGSTGLRWWCLDTSGSRLYAARMDVSLNPELAARVEQLAAKTGRGPDELVADAMEGYLEELARTRDLLDSRYESLRNGSAQPIEGDEALRLLKERTESKRRRA